MQAFSGWGLSWGGLIDNRQGEWWLIGQILLIMAHLFPAWPGPNSTNFSWPFPITVFGFLVVLFGLILALISFLELGASLSPLPEPKPGAELILIGSYDRCRHPLYQSLIISSTGVVIALGSIFHLLLLLVFSCLLRGKAKTEERRLLLIHKEYRSYQNNTPAIIPKIPLLDWRN